MTLRNWLRLLQGRPCVGLSKRDRSALDRRYGERQRAEGERLAGLVAAAQRAGLPLPVPPRSVVGGVIVHATEGPGLAHWTPADAGPHLPPQWWMA